MYGCLSRHVSSTGPSRIGRQLLLRHGQRADRRDLHRQFADEGAEVVRAGDEVRLAVDLDHRSYPSAGVDVALYQPLLRRAVGLLLSHGETPLAQDQRRLLLIAAGFR